MRERKQNKLPARYEKGFLSRLDGRTEIARELRAAFDEIVADQGGIEGLSHVRRSLVERFVLPSFTSSPTPSTQES